jgi:hypothetical protein
MVVLARQSRSCWNASLPAQSDWAIVRAATQFGWAHTSSSYLVQTPATVAGLTELVLALVPAPTAPPSAPEGLLMPLTPPEQAEAPRETIVKSATIFMRAAFRVGRPRAMRMPSRESLFRA